MRGDAFFGKELVKPSESNLNSDRRVSHWPLKTWGMAIIGLLVAIIAWLCYGNRAQWPAVEISYSTQRLPPKRKMPRMTVRECPPPFQTPDGHGILMNLQIMFDRSESLWWFKMRWCKVPGSAGMPDSYYLMTRTYNQSPDSYMILPLDLAPFTDLPVVRYWICLRHGHLLGCHQPPRAGHVLPRCVCPCREPRGESCDRQLLADLLYGAGALTKSGSWDSWDWIVYVHIDGPSS